ncbi:unnamed protein product [Thelazia callipaeda]|uniref:ETS domain-containing protein n=1 Tax=Thelazia callipaeda TaxID=103827 RepID=A0A0N5CSX3_THECL|nr:unnamed protein product [Thelazia callipaeda]
MTYEKLSRAMRTYYEKQILVPVPKTGLYPKKLVYKFGPSAEGWDAVCYEVEHSLVGVNFRAVHAEDIRDLNKFFRKFPVMYTMCAAIVSLAKLEKGKTEASESILEEQVVPVFYDMIE